MVSRHITQEEMISTRTQTSFLRSTWFRWSNPSKWPTATYA